MGGWGLDGRGGRKGNVHGGGGLGVLELFPKVVHVLELGFFQNLEQGVARGRLKEQEHGFGGWLGGLGWGGRARAAGEADRKDTAAGAVLFALEQEERRRAGLGRGETGVREGCERGVRDVRVVWATTECVVWQGRKKRRGSTSVGGGVRWLVKDWGKRSRWGIQAKMGG